MRLRSSPPLSFTNRDRSSPGDDFTLLRQGRALVDGRKAVWQDSSRVAGSEGARLFQREIAVMQSDTDAILFVFTPPTPDVDLPTRALLGEAWQPQ